MSRGEDHWKGPPHMNEQLLKFVTAKLEKGMTNKDAAIEAGAKPSQAHTYAYRWMQFTVVQQYIDNVYSLDVDRHKDALITAINTLKGLAGNKKESSSIRRQASKDLLDYYKDTVIQEKVLESHFQETIKTLHDMMQKPVPVRTEADLYE